MSDILIAGGASFVGSNFANYMMQHTKYSVATLDNLRSGSLQNLAPAQAAKNRHTFYLADIKDEDIGRKIFEIEQPTTVIYNCLTDAGNNWENDIEILRKFIWTSKSSFTEQRFIVLLPAEYHGTIWEQAVEEVLNEFSYLEWALIKPCYVFGPRQKWGVVADTITIQLNGGEFPNPDAEPKEWMYVKDYFANFMKIVEAEDDFESGKYTLHSGQWASDANIDSFVRDVIANKPEKHSWNVEKGKEAEPGNQIPMTRNFDLVNALEHTIVWYDRNRWAWK